MKGEAKVETQGPWQFGDVIRITDNRVNVGNCPLAVVAERGSKVSGPGDTYRYRVIFIRESDGRPYRAVNIYTDEAKLVGCKTEEETIALFGQLREAEEARSAYRELEAVRWANGIL